MIDLEPDCVAGLEAAGLNCYSGTLGPIVQVPNTTRNNRHLLRLNYDFPPNLHEYDIVVIDLQNGAQVPYVADDHVLRQTKRKESGAFLSSYPQTLFDQRPWSGRILGDKLGPLLKKEAILLVFAARDEEIEYKIVSVSAVETGLLGERSCRLYAFYPGLPKCQNIVGEDTTVVVQKDGRIGSLLERHNTEAMYDIVFSHPVRQGAEGNPIRDENFLPLMEAGPGQVVAFVHIRGNSHSLVMPRIKRKKEFLLDLFRTVLPEAFPSLFPHSTRFTWLEDSHYRLPNEQALLTKRGQIQREYEAELREIDRRMQGNREEYSFLHDLITQSGDTLVKTVETYLG